MKPEEKKFIIILTVVVAIIVGGLLFWNNQQNKGQTTGGSTTDQNTVEEYVQNLEDGSKLNISEELRKTKQFEGLEITNIQLKEKGGITTLLADVENKTGAQTNTRTVKIDILDKSGNVLTTLKSVTISGAATGEKVQLNASVTADVANAYDFKISQ